MADHNKTVWRRDIAFYGVIPALGAWIAVDCATDTKSIAGVILAGLIGMKAKMSNGNPNKDHDKE